MGEARPLGGEREVLAEKEEEEEEVLLGADDCCCLPQVFLWIFQSAFWQSREQYEVDEHLAQRLRVTSGGDLLQDSQAAIVGVVVGFLMSWDEMRERVLSGESCDGMSFWGQFTVLFRGVLGPQAL